MMAEESSCYGLDGKIICTICRKHCVLRLNGDGMVLYPCSGNGQGLPASAICREDIAAKVSEASQIADFYLDFLYVAVEEIAVSKSGMSVKMQRINSEKKSDLLHSQDHWLVHHSLRGDARAKEYIVLHIAPLLKRHLYSLNRKASLQRCDLEDLEQKIWVSVFSYLNSYSSRYRLWTWIKCIATREFYKQLSNGRNVYPSEDAVTIRTDKRQRHRPSNIDYWESCEYVRNLLGCLTVRERRIVFGYVFEHKSSMFWRRKRISGLPISDEFIRRRWRGCAL